MKRTTIGVLLTMVAVVALSGPAFAVTAGVWQNWSYPASEQGFYNVDQGLKVNKTGPTRFFAHQVGFHGGDVAYIGIQDTPHGRIAIFSVWNSPGGATTGNKGSKCSTFGGEGDGWSCQVPYKWKVGRRYRLRLWTTQTNAAGEVQWLGTVKELPNGRDTFIGYLWSRAGQGWITNSISWIEDWSVNAENGRCQTEKSASGTFVAPHLNNNTAFATLGDSQTATCAGTSHSSTIRRVPSRPDLTAAILTQ